ncbi:MAG: restriction endonuclease subunit S, partial [Lachnospiraceae bacterium]|nr:restriction endonuclease subunit S [Lachnospiraceae bacterium]
MEKPKIRFKGYNDAWEQRKLGEVFEEYAEKNHPELPALTIIQGGGTVRRDESERNILYDKDNLSGYKLVRKNDFIMHLRSFEGGLEKATSDGVISPAYHTFHGVEADARFYYAYFRSYDFIKIKLVPHIYGIRDGKSIDVEGMKSIRIPYPSFAEQKKIGDYIDTLDKLITFYQYKCDETKTLKKYMLQKMFPKDGEKVPEIRFSGFTDAWEQRKLSEVAEFSKGNGYSKGDLCATGTPIILYGRLYTKYETTIK